MPYIHIKWEYKTDAHTYIHVIIITSISLRDRDIKYAFRKIRNHIILKLRTGLHIFQHKSGTQNIPSIKIYAKIHICTQTNACIYMHPYTSLYVHVHMYSHRYRPTRTCTTTANVREHVWIYKFINQLCIIRQKPERTSMSRHNTGSGKH